MSLSTFAAPANDNFANALLLESSGGLTASNSGATSEPGEPHHGGGGSGGGTGWYNTVWYKFVAPSNGVYMVTTSPGGLTDTLMSAYTGSAVNALTLVAENNNYPGISWCSRISFTVVEGQTYYIAVDGNNSNQGGFGLLYQLRNATLNDHIGFGVRLPSGDFNPENEGLSSSTYGATSQPDEPVHEFDAGYSNNSVWYEWEPEESGTVTFSTEGSTSDTVLAVYRGTNLATLQLQGRNDDFGPAGTLTSQVTFFAEAGTEYSIAIDGYHNSTGNTRLTWRQHYRENKSRMNFNRDGDHRSDLALYRPSNGQWWLKSTEYDTVTAATFGAGNDIPTPADFTGDGETDIAIFRPSSGEWFVLRSEDASFYSVPFGAAGDIPAPGHFTHDKGADPAVFRPSTGTWYIRRTNGSAQVVQFGTSGDVPVVADYDGDGYSDVAIFRPSNGQWWINRSFSGVVATTFGASTDKPVIGDYTGDGRTDVAFWRPSSGEWFILRSENLSYYSFPFGTAGDIPAPADYDRNGHVDPTVFRPSTGVWYSIQEDVVLTYAFGSAGDRPVAAVYTP